MKRAVDQDKVLAIIGPMTTGEFFAAGPIAQQSKVVTFGISLTANGVTEGGTTSSVTLSRGNWPFRSQ